MKQLFFIVFFTLFFFSPNNITAQNSGERYYVCTVSGCAILGNQFCNLTYAFNPDGTVTTYWCVIWVVEGDPVPVEDVV